MLLAVKPPNISVVLAIFLSAIFLSAMRVRCVFEGALTALLELGPIYKLRTGCNVDAML
jgi:hypothetical protein